MVFGLAEVGLDLRRFDNLMDEMSPEGSQAGTQGWRLWGPPITAP